MDQAAVSRWLERYIEAWRTYDPDAIGDLFSVSAEYRYHPAEGPLVGREAIVADWLANRDRPGTYKAEYRPFTVNRDRAVAVGWTSYFTDTTQSTVTRVYDNCYLMEFDDDGRCRSFIEFYRKRPDRAG